MILLMNCLKTPYSPYPPKGAEVMPAFPYAKRLRGTGRRSQVWDKFAFDPVAYPFLYGHAVCCGL